MKKIALIGNVSSGKTTISQALLDMVIEYKKTQMVEVLGGAILDTPGEYLERRQMRGTLAIIATEADVIGLVISPIDDLVMLPPGYAGSFAKPVIGIVTKIDLASDEQISYAIKNLQMAGVSKIFKVSCVTDEGMAELKAYLEID